MVVSFSYFDHVAKIAFPCAYYRKQKSSKLDLQTIPGMPCTRQYYTLNVKKYSSHTVP